MPTELMDELGISNEDMASLNQNGYLPLTKKAAQALAKHKELVEAYASTPTRKQATCILSTLIRVGHATTMVRYGYRKRELLCN